MSGDGADMVAVPLASVGCACCRCVLRHAAGRNPSPPLLLIATISLPYFVPLSNPSREWSDPKADVGLKSLPVTW